MSDQANRLSERDIELRRRECAANFHQPYHWYSDESRGYQECKCGAVTWKREGER